MYSLSVKRHFDSAHKLSGYDGKCNRLHGHSFIVEATVEGDLLNSINMIIDFSLLKKGMDSIIEEYLDHYYLNETLQEENPTAEYLAKWIYDEMKEGISFMGLKLTKVMIWESPDCCAGYSEVE